MAMKAGNPSNTTISGAKNICCDIPNLNFVQSAEKISFRCFKKTAWNATNAAMFISTIAHQP